MIKRNTWVLLGVFAILMASYYLLNVRQDSSVEDFPPTSTPFAQLFDFLSSEISSIRLENQEGQAVQFSKIDEVWQSDEPFASPEETDLLRIEGLTSQLASLELVFEKRLDEPLDVLGLENPSFQLTVELVDGTRHVVQIGDPSVTNTGYYVSLDGSAARLARKSVLDQFINLLEQPALLPIATPELDVLESVPDSETGESEDVEVTETELP